MNLQPAGLLSEPGGYGSLDIAICWLEDLWEEVRLLHFRLGTCPCQMNKKALTETDTPVELIHAFGSRKQYAAALRDLEAQLYRTG